MGPMEKGHYGIKNGDRSYKLEIKPNTNIGSFHVLDGHKVTVRYPGQQQTCARCHETAQNCRGGGMARRCEAAGGVKVELSEYILGLWEKIGYSPGELEVAAVYDDHGEEVDPDLHVSPQVGGNFTPDKVLSDPEKFTGVTVKQFPKETDQGLIVEFLIESGLPESFKDTVMISSFGSATIRNLENSVCRTLIENIHNKRNFGRKLFCNGIIPLSPEKSSTDTSASVSSSASMQSPSRSSSATLSGTTSTPAARLSPSTKSATSPSTQTATSPLPGPELPPPISPLSLSGTPVSKAPPQSMIPETPDLQHLANLDLVGKHSLSLRTPVKGSLAYDIITTSNPHLQKVQALMSDFKESLSDFGSCLSSDSEADTSSDELIFKTVGRKKSGKKRKNSITPSKNFFLKKQNRETSPQ